MDRSQIILNSVHPEQKCFSDAAAWFRSKQTKNKANRALKRRDGQNLLRHKVD